MSKKSDQRDLYWARQQFPLLARRSDSEVLKLVKEGREQLGSVAKFIATAGGVLGFLLGAWVEKHWLPQTFSGRVESAIPILAAVLAGHAGAAFSEHMVWRRVETLLRGPVKRF